MQKRKRKKKAHNGVKKKIKGLYSKFLTKLITV